MLKPRAHRYSLLVWLTLAPMLPGCVSPVAKLHRQASGFGFVGLDLSGGGFMMRGFLNQPAPAAARLHVYLEGDGRPWERGVIPAAEPTTRDSVILPLMAADPAPSLYLGRPCYNGHAEDPGCTPELWTGSRYGENVVASMAQALQRFIERNGYRELVLIGHSGGGTLALLLAERLPQTAAVVTLAGNYDIDRWTAYHGYQPLQGSLNPALRPPGRVPEWHLLGERDPIVPPALFEPALSARPHAGVIRVDADHSRGWQAIWPEILQRLHSVR
ncbi:alpha/beta fold hydrolase [Methylomonas koyamae]|uniref:alpha/beta fold hydrolase n=1 Tax=Methylomonas koyamae TaxID=702114 RepID=UPI000BC2EB00|nr:alpha/beta fold hydrolase [Methylomonas koyamae]ATG89454.1 alpha/beta hydrolase [Methylomonas koyamae]